MKSIYLVRHSYTEYSYNKPDTERKLTQEGFQRIDEQMAKLKLKSAFVDIIISSSALRAKQTAQEIKKQLKLEQEILYLDWLYENYTTQDLLDYLQSLANTINSVMLIAHNPTISVMASNFNHSQNYMFMPCALLKLDFGIEHWKDISARAGQVDFYLE